MGINILENVVFLQGLSKVLSLFMIVVLFFYFIFSVLVVRQVSLLNSSFKTEVSFLMTAFAYGHLVATILLFLFTLTTLF